MGVAAVETFVAAVEEMADSVVAETVVAEIVVAEAAASEVVLVAETVVVEIVEAEAAASEVVVVAPSRPESLGMVSFLNLTPRRPEWKMSL